MNAHTPSLARQAWLDAAMSAISKRIERAHGAPLPSTIRISVGFPKGRHGGGKTIGQCWDHIVSADDHYEIFITPELSDSMRIMGVIAHELVHATVGIPAGHKKPFKTLAEAIGLVGKMTATEESEEFQLWAMNVIHKIGKYPAGAMTINLRKKQTARQLKCLCEDCGFVARVARKWIDEAGTPICPTDNISMKCEEIDDEDGDDE